MERQNAAWLTVPTHVEMNRFLKQLQWIEFSCIWHITSQISAFPQLLHISPQTDTMKCPLPLHNCHMSNVGTTPARQLWEMFRTFVSSPHENSTWEFTKIRTSRGVRKEPMKYCLFFPHRDKDHGRASHASNKRLSSIAISARKNLSKVSMQHYALVKSQYCSLMVLLRAVINSTKNCYSCIQRCDYNTGIHAWTIFI